jgi:hypothetical protein
VALLCALQVHTDNANLFASTARSMMLLPSLGASGKGSVTLR